MLPSWVWEEGLQKGKSVCVWGGVEKRNENKSPSLLLYLKIIKHETMINRPSKY